MEANLSPEGSVLSWLSSSEEQPPTLEQENRARQKVEDYRPRRHQDDYTKPILAAFMEHLPCDGKQALVLFIAGADDQELRQLAYHLYTTILLPFQAQSKDAVTPSPFEDSQDAEGDVYQIMIDSASRNDQGRLKKLCLQRDNWRCMLTGALDISQRKYHRTPAASTRLAHILPFSIGRWDDTASEHRISQFWATLHRLFPAVTICPSDVNHSSNLMTLIVPFEICLGNFSLALEPTGEKNEYEILTFPDFETAYDVHLPQPNKNGARIVKFRSHTGLPLPSPAIFRAHASTAKILKSNDIFERIQQVLEMPETTRHLSADGTTELDFLFWRL